MARIRVIASNYYAGGAAVKLCEDEPLFHLNAKDAFNLFCKLGRVVNGKAARRARWKPSPSSAKP